MIHRRLKIGRWIVDFLFADNAYDQHLVLASLYDIDAPLSVTMRAAQIMEENDKNCGFTYTDQENYVALIVVGPTSSGEEFLNTLTHETHHLAVAIAEAAGYSLEDEGPAYLSGDTVMALAEDICMLGCETCRKELK